MHYLTCTKDLVLSGEVGQTPILEVFADADLASCLHTCIHPRARVAFGSTPEPDSVSVRGLYWSRNHINGHRNVQRVYNLQSFLEFLVQQAVHVFFKQDNDAVFKILITGYSAKLRHCGRVHRVNVTAICKALGQECFSAEYCPSSEQRAKGMTKIIPPHEWNATAQQLSLMLAPSTGVKWCRQERRYRRRCFCVSRLQEPTLKAACARFVRGELNKHMRNHTSCMSCCMCLSILWVQLILAYAALLFGSKTGENRRVLRPPLSLINCCLGCGQWVLLTHSRFPHRGGTP